MNAAYAATIRDQLTELFADLPSEPDDEPGQPGIRFDLRLLCLLLCVFPPAGLAYWLYTRFG